ncbi:unnamed protein product [Linum trigynum]|uniref:Uncharacterized protein n=1 Tax=Linum trigynum TaxID=586398 RepID=A0AAV2EX28_9ROSI
MAHNQVGKRKRASSGPRPCSSLNQERRKRVAFFRLQIFFSFRTKRSFDLSWIQASKRRQRMLSSKKAKGKKQREEIWLYDPLSPTATEVTRICFLVAESMMFVIDNGGKDMALDETRGGN